MTGEKILSPQSPCGPCSHPVPQGSLSPETPPAQATPVRVLGAWACLRAEGMMGGCGESPRDAVCGSLIRGGAVGSVGERKGCFKCNLDLGGVGITTWRATQRRPHLASCEATSPVLLRMGHFKQ